jgi:hypothetical protein
MNPGTRGSRFGSHRRGQHGDQGIENNERNCIKLFEFLGNTDNTDQNEEMD